MNHPVTIMPLSPEDGGGYLAFFPDLPGCMGDGETPAEALADALSALDEWTDAANERGVTVPPPSALSPPHFG